MSTLFFLLPAPQWDSRCLPWPAQKPLCQPVKIAAKSQLSLLQCSGFNSLCFLPAQGCKNNPRVGGAVAWLTLCRPAQGLLAFQERAPCCLQGHWSQAWLPENPQLIGRTPAGTPQVSHRYEVGVLLTKPCRQPQLLTPLPGSAPVWRELYPC